MASDPDFQKARDYCINRLKNELSPKLTYHNLGHTIKEVIPAVERIAAHENVDHGDQSLLIIAAYFHDLGFIHQRQGHEAISIRIAEQVLPGFGYANKAVGMISGMIQATCIPQSPANLLESILADADLDYLGNESFWKRSQDLRQELENFGQTFTHTDWLTYQMQFIQAHHYFTISQRLLRDGVKQRHLQEIRGQLVHASLYRTC
jgi:uncharacterized protein